jgi:hypothetical protein
MLCVIRENLIQAQELAKVRVGRSNRLARSSYFNDLAGFRTAKLASNWLVNPSKQAFYAIVVIASSIHINALSKTSISTLMASKRSKTALRTFMRNHPVLYKSMT